MSAQKPQRHGSAMSRSPRPARCSRGDSTGSGRTPKPNPRRAHRPVRCRLDVVAERAESGVLSFVHILPGLAEETYSTGLRALTRPSGCWRSPTARGVAISKTSSTRSPSDSSTGSPTTRASGNVTSSASSPTRRRSLRSTSCATGEPRELLFQADRCEVTLHRANIELASVRAGERPRQRRLGDRNPPGEHPTGPRCPRGTEKAPVLRRGRNDDERRRHRSRRSSRGTRGLARADSQGGAPPEGMTADESRGSQVPGSRPGPRPPRRKRQPSACCDRRHHQHRASGAAQRGPAAKSAKTRLGTFSDEGGASKEIANRAWWISASR